MRKLLRRALACSALLAAVSFAPSAMATPLTMNFCVQDAGGGQYMYTFTLTLDNHDGTWSPGQGFGWIIFGDAQYPGPSQLDPFNGDPGSLPIGPWTSYGGSG